MTISNSGGQISYLILHSLESGAKYGLEIIEEISNVTHGEIEIKKPSLYSALTRLEKRGLVSSSYWGESEQGGKRHYYSITKNGKREYAELCRVFDISQFFASEKDEKPAKDDGKLLLDSERIDRTKEKQPNEPKINISSVVPTVQYITPTPQTPKEEPKEEPKVEVKQVVTAPEDKTEFIDMSKYRKNRSYINSQVLAQEEDNVDKIAELKKSIEELKEKSQSELQDIKSRLSEKSGESQETRFVQEPPKAQEPLIVESKQEETAQIVQQQVLNESEELEVKIKDDGVLLDPNLRHEGNRAKPITPPSLEIKVNYDESRLPPPKRDAKLEPTFEETAMAVENEEQTFEVETVKEIASFSDYDSLKEYYKTHNVKFNTYSKQKIEIVHNTNKLKMFLSFILFGITAVGLAILYLAFSLSAHTKGATNFFYYVPVIVVAGYVIYCIIRNSYSLGTKPMVKYNALIMWVVALLASVVVFLINLCCGMKFDKMLDFSTTLFVPIFLAIVAFPIRYHITNYAYKKYGK